MVVTDSLSIVKNYCVYMSCPGSCDHFYHYVPRQAGHSPSPCDPAGINIMLRCSGYSPPSATVDLIWQWAPNTTAPYSNADFIAHFNWNPSSTVSTPPSGPYAGYNHHETDLTFVGTGVISDLMGYYACIFVHRGASTTPLFDYTPAIFIGTVAGVTTPCPSFSTLGFTEFFTPDICAELAQPTTTAQTTTTTTPPVTNGPTLATTIGANECCDLATYVGIAAALVTSVCICVLGSAAFFICRVINNVARRKQRKIYVGE